MSNSKTAAVLRKLQLQTIASAPLLPQQKIAGHIAGESINASISE
jgi:hypothetical protein